VPPDRAILRGSASRVRTPPDGFVLWSDRPAGWLHIAFNRACRCVVSRTNGSSLRLQLVAGLFQQLGIGPSRDFRRRAPPELAQSVRLASKPNSRGGSGKTGAHRRELLGRRVEHATWAVRCIDRNALRRRIGPIRPCRHPNWPRADSAANQTRAFSSSIRLCGMVWASQSFSSPQNTDPAPSFTFPLAEGVFGSRTGALPSWRCLLTGSKIGTKSVLFLGRPIERPVGVDGGICACGGNPVVEMVLGPDQSPTLDDDIALQALRARAASSPAALPWRSDRHSAKYLQATKGAEPARWSRPCPCWLVRIGIRRIHASWLDLKSPIGARGCRGRLGADGVTMEAAVGLELAQELGLGL